MVNAQDSTGGDTVSVPVEWAVARSGPFGLRGMNSQHSDGFAAEAWLDRLIRSYVFTARTRLSEPPSQAHPRVLFAQCRNEKDEKTWLVMAICEYDRRRLLNIRCYCVPFTEAEFGVSYLPGVVLPLA
jgi:hypothetical protein